MNENDRLPGEPEDFSQAFGDMQDDLPQKQAFAEPSDASEDDDDTDPGERDESDPETGDDRRRRPSGYQRLKRRASALIAENAELHRAVEDLRRRLPAEGGDAGSADHAPREEDFRGDNVAYERALAAHMMRQAAREAIRGELHAKAFADAQLGREAENKHGQVEAYNSRADSARDRIDDFDEAMLQMRGVTVRNAVADEIMSSDKGPLIAYHLAKNPAELHELNGMTARELLRAVGRLEGRLSLPKANTATKTLPPPNIPRGGASASSDPSKMSQRDYEAWRKRGGGKG